jgi:transaldolase
MNTVVTNPLLELNDLGQSVWLDHLDRQILEDGTLARLTSRDGVSGITSNPTILAAAIDSYAGYRPAIRELQRRSLSTQDVYEHLVLHDVKRAADLLQPVYIDADSEDGFVSLEVSPHLANDTAASVDEARRLWQLLERDNVMIKVPGTRAGLPAVRQLIAEGINVNVTLLFSPQRYAEVLDAYMLGLEDRLASGVTPLRVSSVASFFISRIDARVDPLLDAAGGHAVEHLRGRAAIACAGLAYQHNQASHATEPWKHLVKEGAAAQRLLWASTSTKDPAYSDVKYVDALAGADTVVTMPMKTLDAYRDHGCPLNRLDELAAEASSILEALTDSGVKPESVYAELEEEGVRKFADSFDHLLAGLENRKSPDRGSG